MFGDLTEIWDQSISVSFRVDDFNNIYLKIVQIFLSTVG